ncbi:MAG: Bifunctional NAD(P)H-hydrate repair enzyme, partial [Sediminibacterium sp.]|nr:Bifunctional NAD(P)H-hydrate repair enzyme [Sediminibacterium sp.]
ASSPVIKAANTLSFQFPKLAFFFPENGMFTGDWKILQIGLSETFIAKEPAANYQLTKTFIQGLLKPRQKFSHKGTYGHAMLIAGSYGKIGAAILAARACLRSGPGLLTVHLPQCGHDIMQTTNPEAMVSPDTKKHWVGDEILTKTFSAVGIGPGLGTNEQTQKTFHYIITRNERPLVIDADALNILGMHKDWLEQLPVNSILTPHPKEFERLVGTTSSDFERHELQITFSKKYKLFIILKGAHTCITTPAGESYFNTTGNPGMAKGGSGDILTGILTGILAQGYSPLETCLISVFVHGLAGDLTRELLGETGMIAGDICDHLPEAFKQLYQPEN